MREIETEVLIVGAGPAGISTSFFLSQKKIPHILIDKAVFPRDKICGDALSGKVVQELNRIDSNLIDEIEADKLNFIGSYGVKFVSPGGQAVDIPFKTDLSSLKNAPGYISPRINFDNFLVKKLVSGYSTFLENTSLENIVRNDDGIIAELLNHGDPISLKTKLVVSAEGERSKISRALGNYKQADKHFCAGVRAYYRNVKGLHEQNFIELHFLPEMLPGYLWIFPLPGGKANVGAGMLSSSVKKNNISLRKKLTDILEHHPRFKDRFSDATLEGQIKGWGLPLGSKRRKISGDNFILTGDAASLIDPFTGEGIGNAMVSGRLAAEKISEAVQEQRYDRNFLSGYDSKIYSELSAELKLSHTLQRLSSQAWLFNWVVKKAASNKEVSELITGMFEDLNIRAKLRQPGFYFKLFFNK
ncbi:MAG: geranylgeranyl reductase family protein [Bacteroidetes bacterium]|nr:MAG: geranylgeranyl reductase family protein [Bacteroidota bacterium]